MKTWTPLCSDPGHIPDTVTKPVRGEAGSRTPVSLLSGVEGEVGLPLRPRPPSSLAGTWGV